MPRVRVPSHWSRVPILAAVPMDDVVSPWDTVPALLEQCENWTWLWSEKILGPGLLGPLASYPGVLVVVTQICDIKVGSSC